MATQTTFSCSSRTVKNLYCAPIGNSRSRISSDTAVIWGKYRWKSITGKPGICACADDATMFQSTQKVNESLMQMRTLSYLTSAVKCAREQRLHGVICDRLVMPHSA